MRVEVIIGKATILSTILNLNVWYAGRLFSGERFGWRVSVGDDSKWLRLTIMYAMYNERVLGR